VSKSVAGARVVQMKVSMSGAMVWSPDCFTRDRMAGFDVLVVLAAVIGNP
jgi:hypothetical protein